MNNRKYVTRLILIILLTNIPAALSLPLFFKEALGWILGTIASAVNLYWLAYNVSVSLDQLPSKARLNLMKGTYLRLLFMLVWSILIMSVIKPNLIFFGLGLLSGQMVIYVYEFISRLKSRENQEEDG